MKSEDIRWLISYVISWVTLAKDACSIGLCSKSITTWQSKAKVMLNDIDLLEWYERMNRSAERTPQSSAAYEFRSEGQTSDINLPEHRMLS